MSLFGKPTLEARLQSLVAAIAGAFNLNQEQSSALSGGDLTPLETAVASQSDALRLANEANVTLTTANETLTTDLAAANQRAQNLDIQLGAANTSATNLAASLRDTLQLSAEQLTALNGGDLTVITAAITQLAQRKAVEIAAGQGVPPVITDPSASSAEDDEIALAFQAAREEKDPRKRGALYQRASNLVKQKKSKSKN